MNATRRAVIAGLPLAAAVPLLASPAKAAAPDVADITTWTLANTNRGNLFDAKAAQTGFALNGTNGLVSPSSALFATPFIPVLPGRLISSNFGLFNVAWYDIARGFISGQSVGAPGLSFPLTVPAGAYYMRTGDSLAILNKLVLTEGAMPPASPVPATYYGLGPYSRWNNAQMACVGDSITFIAYYQPIIRDILRTRWKRFTNDGQSGIVVSQALPVLTASNLSDVDLLTHWLGTNDFAAGTPLNDFRDAVEANVEAAFTANPAISLVLITPLKRGVGAGSNRAWSTPNTVGAVLADYADIIIEVGEKYSCPVLDLFRTSGVNDLNFSTRLADGLHPAHGFYPQLGQQIAAFLRSI